MNIERKRWVITRKGGTEIFCGLARNYQFKPIDDIGDTAVKTYVSKKKAVAAVETSFYGIEDYEAVEITETITNEPRGLVIPEQDTRLYEVSGGEIYEHAVDSVEITTFELDEDGEETGHYGYFSPGDIGDRFFLTWEAADAKLREEAEI